jgi:hypothetical protein
MTNKSNSILAKFRKWTQEPSKDWETYNDQLNTHLFDEPHAQISRSDLITLATDETPWLECNLPNGNYFLVTSQHVYSYFRRYLFKQRHENLVRLNTSTYFFKHPKFGNKTMLYVVECRDQSLLFFEIDNGAPGYYATQLLEIIINT